MGNAGSMLNAARIRLISRILGQNRAWTRCWGSSTFRRKPDCHRDEQDGHDHHVHGRTGQGDEQLLDRPVRDALQSRHTADRQERDVARGHAEPASSQSVPQFMQDHAAEKGQDKRAPFQRLRARHGFLPSSRA